MKKNKVEEGTRVFYNLMNEITPVSSGISHHFLFQGRCIIAYYPQRGKRGVVYYAEDADVLEDLTIHISKNFEKIREGVLHGKGMIFYLVKEEADKILYPFENALKVPVSYGKMDGMMPDIVDCISLDINKGTNNLMKLVFGEKI